MSIREIRGSLKLYHFKGTLPPQKTDSSLVRLQSTPSVFRQNRAVKPFLRRYFSANKIVYWRQVVEYQEIRQIQE